MRALIAAFLALALALNALASGARADGPSPSPTIARPPRPSPSIQPSRSATPTPATPVPADVELTPEERAALEAARLALAAQTLRDRVEAFLAYLRAELAFLGERLDAVREERQRLRTRIAAVERDIRARRDQLDRALLAAQQLSRRTPLETLVEERSLVHALVHAQELANVAGDQQRLADGLRRLRAELADEEARLRGLEEELGRLANAAAAKERDAAALELRAVRLVSAQGRSDQARLAAEHEVLRELIAREQSAHAAVSAEVARLARAAQAELSTSSHATLLLRWAWPIAGTVTQEFGPSALALEPSRAYGGVRHAHFHDGLDIAAPLYAPVRAAADGRVSFAGRIADGAVVVLLVHADGHVSLYAHLDDALRPPAVKAGDRVRAGDVVGFVGLTGVTTGPHLHFALLRGEEPIDPRTVLPPR